MAKAKKKRADKYEKKLQIDGSFEDVIKLSAQPMNKKADKRPEEKNSKPE